MIDATPQFARSYPFALPERSYLFRDGTVEPLGEFDASGRAPVLGAGSNQSHEQVARKFALFRKGCEIPVQRAWLEDFDTVYSAQITHYGSIPATFIQSRGTRVSTFVLWLDDTQLEWMHATEANYDFDRLDDIRIFLDGSIELLPTGFVYSARVGCLALNDEPVALAEIPARGRKFPAMTQSEIQSELRDRMDAGTDLDRFVEAQIADEAIRSRRRSFLASKAIIPGFPRRTVASL